MKEKNRNQNLLDFIPVQNPKYKVEISDEGQVTIFVENKGPFNWVAQKIFGKPRFSQVHLEEFGNFIWPQIDGKKTVKDIADLVHDKFGEKADPLYPRISMYIKMLRNYDFITFIEPEMQNK